MQGGGERRRGQLSDGYQIRTGTGAADVVECLSLKRTLLSRPK
jgi:hypothetical protein